MNIMANPKPKGKNKKGPKLRSGLDQLPTKKKKKSKKTYAHNTHDPHEALKRYKANHLDKYTFQKAQTINTYTPSGKVQIRLIPATWNMVFTYAAVNALLIFLVKVVWIAEFGKLESDFLEPNTIKNATIQQDPMREGSETYGY